MVALTPPISPTDYDNLLRCDIKVENSQSALIQHLFTFILDYYWVDHVSVCVTCLWKLRTIGDTSRSLLQRMVSIPWPQGLSEWRVCVGGGESQLGSSSKSGSRSELSQVPNRHLGEK